MRKEVSQLTAIMDESAQIGLSVINKLKADFGGIQFGQREPTRYEKRERARREINRLIDELGG